MNKFALQVSGQSHHGRVSCIRPVFLWKAPQSCQQFTIELAKDNEFQNIIYLRDTHEQYSVYDSVPLQPDMVYYIRVRSGMGEWSEASFWTEHLTSRG